MITIPITKNYKYEAKDILGTMEITEEYHKFLCEVLSTNVHSDDPTGFHLDFVAQVDRPDKKNSEVVKIISVRIRPDGLVM